MQPTWSKAEEYLTSIYITCPNTPAILLLIKTFVLHCYDTAGLYTAYTPYQYPTSLKPWSRDVQMFIHLLPMVYILHIVSLSPT